VRAFQSLSSSSQAAADKPSTELTDKQIVGNLLGYVWPAGNAEFKVRVIGAVGLLLGSKLLNIQVRRRSTSWRL
jgi:ATP-binding cassette, subfamily B (MDR/TAP), member 7